MTTPRPYRLVHSSDWHLGHELFGHDRATEHDVFLAWLIERLAEEEADLLLVTGDVYDVANPPVAATERLYRFLREATARFPALAIAIVGGNHDSAARINLPAALLGPGRVHLIGALPRRDGGPDCERLLIPLADRDGRTAAWLAAVPFCRPGELGAGGLAALYAQVLEEGAARAGNLPLVVTGHLHIAGGDVSALSERRITIGGEEAEAASLFDRRASYVALGHLHRPQRIAGAAPIRYAGSPFPLSATERVYRHSISVVDLTPAGADVREVVIPRPAPFLAIPAEGARPIDAVETAIAAIAVDPAVPPGLRPFVEVSVLVDRPEPGLYARIAKALEGKAVRLAGVARIAAREATSHGIAARAADLTDLRPDAVFAELHVRRHGSTPAPDLARAFEALLVETQGRGDG